MNYRIWCVALLITTAYALAQQKAFVGNLSGDVFVVNLNTGMLETTLSVGSQAFLMAMTPDNKTVYVAGGSSNSVILIDVATNTIQSSISVLPNLAPFGVAITPDGKTAYVSCRGSNAVVPITIATGAVGAGITVGTSPVGLAVTPDGTKVYVANNNSNSVSVIDVSSNMIITTVNGLLGHPSDVAITPDSSIAYVSNDQAAAVTPIYTANNTAGTPISVEINGPTDSVAGGAVTPDGTTLYVANTSAGAAVPINVASGQVGTPITVGNGSFIIAISSDGTRAYVTNQGSGTLTPIELPSNIADPAIMGLAGAVGLAITMTTPPTNVTGTIVNNKFLLQTQFVLKIQWQPSITPSVSAYQIYNSGSLVGTVSAQCPSLFNAFLPSCAAAQNYSIAAVTSDGGASRPVPVTVS